MVGVAAVEWQGSVCHSWRVGLAKRIASEMCVKPQKQPLAVGAWLLWASASQGLLGQEYRVVSTLPLGLQLS